MLRRLLLCTAFVVLAGCGDKPQPPMGTPPPLPCPTWNNPECQNGMSRPAMLQMVKNAADAAHAAVPPTISEQLYESIIGHINKYNQDQNCKATIDDGAGDCAARNVSNCACLQMAMQAAQAGNWPTCTTRLAQGH